MRFNSTSSRRARRLPSPSAKSVGTKRPSASEHGSRARAPTWATNRAGLRPRRWRTGRPPPQPRPRSPSRSVSTTRPRRRRRALGRPCPPPPTRRHPRRPTPRRPTPRSPNAWTVSRSRTTSRRPPPRPRPRPPTPTPRLTRRPGARPPAASATTSRVNQRATARKRAVAVAVAEGVHTRGGDDTSADPNVDADANADDGGVAMVAGGPSERRRSPRGSGPDVPWEDTVTWLTDELSTMRIARDYRDSHHRRPSAREVARLVPEIRLDSRRESRSVGQAELNECARVIRHTLDKVAAGTDADRPRTPCERRGSVQWVRVPRYVLGGDARPGQGAARDSAG